jgi:DNA-binding CsgD family transcriptional regulator
MNDSRLEKKDATSRNFPKLPTAADDLNGGERDLSDKQCAAIELLAEGKNSGQVARVLEVDRRTVYTWRQKELFRRALAHRRRQLWGEVSARLRGMVHPSLDELERQLHERYDRARFRAASAILRLADVKNCPEPEEESLD